MSVSGHRLGKRTGNATPWFIILYIGQFPTKLPFIKILWVESLFNAFDFRSYNDFPINDSGKLRPMDGRQVEIKQENEHALCTV